MIASATAQGEKAQDAAKPDNLNSTSRTQMMKGES